MFSADGATLLWATLEGVIEHRKPTALWALAQKLNKHM